MYENSFKDSDWRGFWNPVCQGSAGKCRERQKLYIPVGKNIPITVHRYQQLTVRKIFPVQRIMK